MGSKKSEEYLLKLIMIGDSGVGKTNILVRFCQNDFKANYVATIGVDFKIKTLTIDGQRLKFQIWDTAGQQRYKTIAQTYYRGAAGIILTYSVTDPKSFENIEKWMLQISQSAPKEVVRVLVGNKCDLAQEREVSYEQGQALAQKHKLSFIQVSAKQGKNVNELFNTIGKQLISKYLPNKKIQDPAYYQKAVLGHAQISSKGKKNCEC